MFFRFKLQILFLSSLLILIGGIGHTESDTPEIFEYNLPVVNDKVYANGNR